MLKGIKKKKTDNKVAISSLLDMITPQAIEFKRKEIIIGDQLARVLVITDYTNRVSPAWISRAINLPGVTASIHINPTDAYDLVNSINKSLGELRSKLESGGSELTKERNTQKYNDAKILMKKIDQEQQQVFYFNCILMVTANDKETLERRTRRLESSLASQGLRARTSVFRQEEGLLSIGPWGILSDEIKEVSNRNMPSETVAASFAFVSEGINDSKGIVLGRDKSNGICLIDIWKRGEDRTNSNITLIGKPGVGKSTTAKKIMANEYAKGTKIICIDPEREYKDMCENLGGNWVDCGGGAKGRINPLQIKVVPLDDEDESEEDKLYKETSTRGPLALHIQTLRTFFKLYLRDLTDIDMAILEDVLVEVYGDKNITWQTDPSTIKNKDWPIMEDLYYKLDKKSKADNADPAYRRLALLIKSASIGADSALWNGHTTVDINHNFTVLDTNFLQEADDKIRRAQYFNILSWAWNEISKNREEKVLLPVDECYLLIDPEVPQALKFLRNVSKRIRKYEGGLMPITQNVVDFLDPAVRRYGQALLDNPTYKVLMGQGEKDLEGLVKLMNLSEREQEILAQGKRSEALLVAGSKRVHIRVELAEHEPELFGKAGGR